MLSFQDFIRDGKGKDTTKWENKFSGSSLNTKEILMIEALSRSLRVRRLRSRDGIPVNGKMNSFFYFGKLPLICVLLCMAPKREVPGLLFGQYGALRSLENK